MNASTDNSRPENKFRVLFWNELHWPHVGGIERFSEELFAALGPRGFEFRVVTSALPGCPEEEVREGVRIHRLPLRAGLSGSPADFKRTMETVRRLKEGYRPHLTHLNTNGPSFLYHYLTMKTAPHPTLFTFHFDATRENAVETLRKMLAASDRVTAVSRNTLEKARQFFPEIRGKDSVIHNGLPRPTVPLPAPTSPQAAAFLSWGRLAANKGFDVGLRAFAKIAAPYPQARLTLAGDGPEREALRALRRQLGLEESVAMPGYLAPAELEREIQACTALLMPSLEQECFGLVALEAMQRGKAVIASRCGGLTEVVEDSITGLLCPPGDEAALAQAMRRLIEKPGLAAAMGAEGRLRAEKLFSLEAMARGYETLYREMIAEASAPGNSV